MAVLRGLLGEPLFASGLCGLGLCCVTAVSQYPRTLLGLVRGKQVRKIRFDE